MGSEERKPCYDHLVRVVAPGKPDKHLKNVPKRIRCPKAGCKHYELGVSPGTDTCIGCARSYLAMPDKYEPRGD